MPMVKYTSGIEVGGMLEPTDLFISCIGPVAELKTIAYAAMPQLLDTLTNQLNPVALSVVTPIPSSAQK